MFLLHFYKAMEVNQQNNSVILHTCVKAFKQGDHGEALRLLPSLQQPAAVLTDAFHKNKFTFTNVSLLHLAALHGWMDIVASLVCKYNCSSQCCDSGGQTPLHYAAHGGSLPVVQYLITEQHCDPLQCNNYNGGTPFLYACEAGHLEIVEYLITECKCDPASSNNGESELSINTACLGGQMNVVKYLINSQHCSPNSRGQWGWTPLHNACYKGHMEIVEYLIKELGCDPVSPDSDGDLPIHIACLGGQLNVVKYLITNKYCTPDCKGELGRTPLHSACDEGHMDIVEYLVKEVGSDPALPDNDGDLPIHIACRGSQLNVVKYLITNKYCTPDCKGMLGWTPLHSACGIGHMEIVEYLIKEVGCDPAIPDNNEDRPIHIACLCGQLNVVKYLITNKYCTPDCKGEFGRTPLHNACQEGHMEIVEYLINEVGCDPASPDNDGDLPIHIACLGGQLNVVKYLITNKYCTPDCKGEFGRTPLHSACDKGHMEIVEYLIKEQGCDPASPDNNGDLPIHIACHSGQLNVVKHFIINKYYTTDCKEQFGQTLLYLACGIGHMEIIEYLIKEVGCDPASPDNNGDLPIHIACLCGKLNVVKYLITNKHCTPDCKGEFGRTPLHKACDKGHTEVVEYVIKELGCDPTSRDNNGDMPIHVACFGGQLNVVKYLITNKYCSLNCKGKWGRTPLHHACDKGHINIIQYLISESSCILTLPDNSGNMAIHTACLSGQLNVVKYLISNQHFIPNCSGKWGQTPLHLACHGGHMSIIQYLINELDVHTDGDIESLIHNVCVTGQLNILKFLISKHKNVAGFVKKCGQELLHDACGNGYVDIVECLVSEVGCNPASPDNDGNLHVACLGGHLNVVKYLITNRYCSPNSTDEQGRTLLHHACVKGHMNIVRYLIKELDCNPLVLDDNHSTPLHLACNSGHIQIVQWLLRDGRVDVMSVNKSGCTPIDYAKLSVNSYELLEVFQLFQPLLKSRKDYPIHTYTKAVLTGNSGAGKTTLAQAFINQDTAVSSHWFQTFRKHPQVEQLTAGIVSHLVPSHNMILYDLAGHTEFYFSQSTIMEVIVQNSMAIFINLVDLSKGEDEIKHAVYYWLNFIEDATCKSDEKSLLLMVGSHADKISKSKKEAKQLLVSDLVHRRVTRLEYIGFVSMDCRKLGTKASKNAQFFMHVSTCQQSILARAPSLSIYCHTLYAFLQTKMNMVACQLQTLTTSLTSEGSVIPTDTSFISKLLESLNDKGVIVYLKNKQLEKSWLVVKKELVLKDINGILFSPKYFKEHREIVSSTGIIRLSSFHQHFPEHNPDMLVELMVNLEFCLRVNLSGVETNLEAIVSTTQPENLDQLLFFPSLLKVRQPLSVTNDIKQSCGEHFRSGWCLGCKDYGYRYFTVRFLHVLLLRLAYTFPLPCENISQTHALHGLERRCTIWKNGISWNNDDGIRTVVEVIQQSRWVVVTMFHNKDTRPVEYSRHRSAVIRLVLDLQQELAPDLDTSEYLISPSLLQQQCPIQFLPETSLFAIKDVAKSVLCDNPFILSYNDDKQQICTSDAVFFDPYHRLSFSSVCELMDSSKNDQPVSPALLSEVRECCQQPQLESQSYLSLREHLDKMSIYAGRNPLVSVIPTTCSIYCIHVLCCHVSLIK